MPPKKGKGKGKKGKRKTVDKNKLTNVDRTFCELTITDLNQKLARLRAYLQNTDDANVNLKETLRSLEEDRADVAAHLERTLDERNAEIIELEQRLKEITKIREQENHEAAEKIKELEARYRAMHDQLTSEIKLLTGKLNSLDEFRVQRDILLGRFEDQQSDLKEKDRAHKEALFNLERKFVVEKDMLKKEVEQKLLTVSEDFTRSSEIRNATYTRRLIRENIALQKEIDTLVVSQIKIQQQYREQVDRHKQMTDQYSALDQMKKQLIHNAQNKIAIIEKLTTNYEKLRIKYVEALRCRKMYETAMQQGNCDRFAREDMTTRLRILGQKIEKLKMEKTRLVSLHEQHEMEIFRLREIIQQIKSKVQVAIDAIHGTFGEIGGEEGDSELFDGEEEAEEMEEEEVEEEDGVVRLKTKVSRKILDPALIQEQLDNDIALRKLRRRDLLTELMEILSSHSDKLPETPSLRSLTRSDESVYRPGRMGFLPRTKSSLMEIFKRSTTRAESIETLAEYQVVTQENMIIPKEHSFEEDSLIDVELGSTLYVSSSHEALDLPPMEEEPLEEDEGESSSDVSSRKSRSSFAVGKARASVIKKDEDDKKAAEDRIEADQDGDLESIREEYDDEGEYEETEKVQVDDKVLDTSSRVIFDVEEYDGEEEYDFGD